MPTGWRSERGDSWGAGAGVRAGFGDEVKPELSRKGRKEVGKEGGVGGEKSVQTKRQYEQTYEV